MNSSPVSFVVDEAFAEQRLDVVAAAKISNMSRTHIQKLIDSGLITVNGQLQKANYRLRIDDAVVVTIPAAQPTIAQAQQIPLDIVFEDQDIIVVNKPRNMVVHPAAGHWEGTLVNALLGRCTDLSGINGIMRPGIVHRLDKDTSGLLVVAKNDQAHLSLAKQIQLRTASRKYFAIVHGCLKQQQGIIDAPIGRHSIERKKMAVTAINGKVAITKFTVVEILGSYTLVECKLATGRTHQIRVHLAHIGYPVVGDPKYGFKSCPFAIAGQALHSAELAFFHPNNGAWLTFKAEMPQDMQTILTTLRSRKGSGVV